MRKVLLVYHSVSSEAVPAVLGSFPVSMERFKKQITLANRNGWEFGHVSALFEPVRRDTLYITGDDGTMDWARNVLPWCEREGIPTHTALITGPWLAEPVYSVTHRVQIILAIAGRRVPEPRLTFEQRQYIDKIYAYEADPRRRYLKGACNLILDFDEATALLGPPDEEELSHLRNRFALPADYRGFEAAEFGVHTISHRAFDGDITGYINQELLPCRKMMEEADLKDAGFFTLPMKPRYGAVVEQLVEPLRKMGVGGIFDGFGEWDRNSYIIPRIDAKDAEKILS